MIHLGVSFIANNKESIKQILTVTDNGEPQHNDWHEEKITRKLTARQLVDKILSYFKILRTDYENDFCG